MARRSKLEMWLDVLAIIKGGTNIPTRIAYGSNVSWKNLQQIIESMTSQGLVRELETRNMRRRDKQTMKHYELTQKGEEIVKYFRRGRDLIQVEEVSVIRL